MYTISYEQDKNDNSDIALTHTSISLSDDADAYTLIASFINFMIINGYQRSSIIEALNDILSDNEIDNVNVLNIYF